MSKILIDTHIFLWALSEPEKLSKDQKKALKSLNNTIYVSSISIAELMIKCSLGKLVINFNPIELIEAAGFEQLLFSGQDALRLKEMSFHHKDPFDRMLIAQAQENKLKVMTQDSKFKLYDCKVI